jgi:hypothetical protein
VDYGEQTTGTRD